MVGVRGRQSFAAAQSASMQSFLVPTRFARVVQTRQFRDFVLLCHFGADVR